MRSVSLIAAAWHHTTAAMLRRVLMALAAVAITVVAGIVGMMPAAAQDRPPGGVLTNPVVRSIDLASPAVVRIATLYTAHLRLTACGVTTTLPASGAYTVGGLGSGAFVSANGDILTADHVVDIDRQSLDDSIFSGQRVSTDVAAFLNAACHPTVPVTPDDVANGIVQYNGLPFSTSYSAPRVLVWRSASFFGTIDATGTPATTQLTGLRKAPYHEASVVKSSTFGQDDVALIHVGLTDTPSIQLDSSSELAVEDALAVIGFPGNGDVNGDPTNLLTPSINNVNVSAIKRNDNGSQLIQVGGNVEHGDSGGPALDAAGHIVGIVSFGGGDAPGITAFLRSSDSALKILSDAHIDTKPGTFQKLWQEAFADYADTSPGHWHTASREMDALSTRYPEFHGLDAYRQYADAAAVNEASSTVGFLPLQSLPLPLPVLAAIVVGVVLLLVLFIAIAIVRRRARRRAARQSVAVQQPVWSSSGIAPGYNGVPAASAYPPTNYSAPAQPASPNNPWQQPASYPLSQTNAQGYSSVYTPTYAPPYSGYPPQGNSSHSNAVQSNASQHDAASQPRPAPATSLPGSAPNTAVGDLCVNGHQMPPGATHCPVCGAGRASSTTPASRDASESPWSQNW